MKLEIIECSTGGTIETYSLLEFYMSDLQGWKEQNEVTIDLGCLSDTVAKLDSVDPEILEPVSYPKEVDFYLSDPIKDRAISQFAESQTDRGESTDQSVDSDKISEQAYTPELKSSTILSAIVTEILQNHHPYSEYEVRISDG